MRRSKLCIGSLRFACKGLRWNKGLEKKLDTACFDFRGKPFFYVQCFNARKIRFAIAKLFEVEGDSWQGVVSAVDQMGIEPTTSRLRTWRSPKLSYWPKTRHKLTKIIAGSQEKETQSDGLVIAWWRYRSHCGHFTASTHAPDQDATEVIKYLQNPLRYRIFVDLLI